MMEQDKKKKNGGTETLLCTTSAALLRVPPLISGHDDVRPLWRILAQSYARRERWYAWCRLWSFLASFYRLNYNTDDTTDFCFRQFACLRWLLRRFEAIVRTASAVSLRPFFLEEAAAFFQDLLYYDAPLSNHHNSNHHHHHHSTKPEEEAAEEATRHAARTALAYYFGPRLGTLLRSAPRATTMQAWYAALPNTSSSGVIHSTRRSLAMQIGFTAALDAPLLRRNRVVRHRSHRRGVNQEEEKEEEAPMPIDNDKEEEKEHPDDEDEEEEAFHLLLSPASSKDTEDEEDEKPTRDSDEAHPISATDASADPPETDEKRVGQLPRAEVDDAYEDDDDDDDDDEIIHEDDDDDDDAMELEEIQAVVAASEKRFRDALEQQQGRSEREDSATPLSNERRALYIAAAMQVLTDTMLSRDAEHDLLAALLQLVQPSPAPNTTQILLRRAPTQEEFFRGALRRNPLPVAALGPADPTVADLRHHIAQELQMADSEELLEIIVANKILDGPLKLRVVQQVLWRKSLLESNNNESSASLSSLFTSQGGGSGSGTLFSTGLALSFLLSNGTPRGRITADTPLEQLPPLVAMYRLVGVDGEATEEHVTDLPDPQDDAAVDAAARAATEMWTRAVTEGRGAAALLRSIQNAIADVLRRIRRDQVDAVAGRSYAEWWSTPPPGLTLLRHLCALGSWHRQRLLQARAPTILLALLLDVLGASTGAASNPTAELLQELIELLTLDISAAATNSSNMESDASTASESYENFDPAQDAASLPLLLQSIETIALSTPLRIVIAKLLPFLTYGQPELCRELSRHFDTYLQGEELATLEMSSSVDDDNVAHPHCDTAKKAILVQTFVQTAISLPANDVCHSLRLALTTCVERLVQWVLRDLPEKPAPWTPALWPLGECAARPDLLEESWRSYYARPGIRTAFQVLTGLCRRHGPTQLRLVAMPGFVPALHWLETISDSANIPTEGLGLLAETLLDELIVENESARSAVESVRSATRSRKKQLAQEQRQRALLKIGSFGVDGPSSVRPVSALPSSSSSPNVTVAASSNRSKSRKRKRVDQKLKDKPEWWSEAEQIQDEVGLTCAVCQEGHTLQPTELLGLYVYMKKVTIPIDHGGSAGLTGSSLLRALPAHLPDSLVGSTLVDAWLATAKSVAAHLSSSSSSHRHRPVLCTATVTAGTGIHYGCHRRARQADRNHPKAPKSEWEGATLRNNRVRCNAILPLVAGPNPSAVPLMAVESALSDYASTVTNALGSSASAPSALWTILQDLRMLVLRMAYNESLSLDCGGGSLASNCQLLYYECFLIHMLDRNAQTDEDALKDSLLAHGLSAGVLAAAAILESSSSDGYSSKSDAETSRTGRHLADAATMGALTSIVFHNTHHADGGDGAADEATSPHPKRQWILGQDYFLQALILCAGRRHALGITGSGCLASNRSSSSHSSSGTDDRSSKHRGLKRRAPSNSGVSSSLEDIFVPLRPLLIYYVILQHLSQAYTPSLLRLTMEGEDPLAPCVERMVQGIESCWKASNLVELLSVANITMDHHSILHWFQKGMSSL